MCVIIKLSPYLGCSLTDVVFTRSLASNEHQPPVTAASITTTAAEETSKRNVVLSQQLTAEEKSKQNLSQQLQQFSDLSQNTVTGKCNGMLCHSLATLEGE